MRLDIFEEPAMTSTDDLLNAAKAPAVRDAFDVLDACHIQTLFTLGKLAALVSHLANSGPDKEARTLAGEIVSFFSATARQHHEDEERHVFPKLMSSRKADIVQAVLRLQQDHAWLEEDWMELAPQVDAVACGQDWYDLDTLREGVEIFAALSRDHIALEESIIYPEARTRLLASERQEMGREMAARKRAQRQATSSSSGAKRPSPS
jgi:hemerythrin-like domain-containing protein